MSEHLVYSDELDGLPFCISAWIGSLELFATWEVYGLQSWDGLFTLPYGHTRDLPLMIVGE
jgi:hypothetical protein